jgi:hypothetical protein
VKEEMTEMRAKYDKKINKLMKQLLEKDEEILRLRSDARRDSNLFQRSSIGKSTEESNLIEPSVIQIDRSLTPNASRFVHHNYNNSSQIHQNILLESMGESVRSSLGFNNPKESVNEINLFDKASRIE